MRMVLLTLATCLLLGSAHPHVVPANDTCPKLKEEDNLSVDKILGTWFVVFQLQPSQPCTFWNITRNPENPKQLQLNEAQLILLTDSIGVELKQFLEGDVQNIDIPDPDVPAKMIIERPKSSQSKVDHFVVFDTDYSNYLAIYECDEGDGFLHRREITILSKLPEHDPVILKRITRLLEKAGISNSFTEITRKIDKCQFYSPHFRRLPTPTATLNVKSTDMNDTLLFDAVGTAREAFKTSRTTREVAQSIKKKFDERYNPTWNCLVGLDMDGSVTYRLGSYIFFALGKTNILLFKSPVNLPDNK